MTPIRSMTSVEGWRWRHIVVVMCTAITIALLDGCSSGGSPYRAEAVRVELHVRGLRVSGDTGALVPFAGTLTCRRHRELGLGMFRGRAAKLCERLRTTPSALSPPPTDRLCAQIVGGPETAEITGRIGATSIDVTVDRTDTCGIAQWERLRWFLGDRSRA